MGHEGAGLQIRPLREDEIDETIRMWHVTKRVAYPYLPLEQGRAIEEDGRFFREHIVPRTQVWVAHDGEMIAGFLALDGDYIDRLYVHPERQGQGVGSALMHKAMELSPGGLRLHTHVKNEQARAFYEHRAFRAVKFGISPPPESEPDVEYHWRPAE